MYPDSIPLSTMAKSSPWTRLPGKVVYTVFFAVKTLFWLPFYAVFYVLPTFRPNKHWTYRQAISRNVVRSVLEYLAVVELKTPLLDLDNTPKIKAPKNGGIVVIQPAEEHVYQDILLCDSEIEPKRLATAWFFPSTSTPSEGSIEARIQQLVSKIKSSSTRSKQKENNNFPSPRIFLHLHGGGFVSGSIVDNEIRAACQSLLDAKPAGVDAPKHKNAAVICPEYRLSSNPLGSFPAAIQDAVTTYAHLVLTLRIPGENIVVTGDSAGGHIALGLLRYILEHPNIFSRSHQPAGVLLFSPWPDMAVPVEEAVVNLQKTGRLGMDFIPPLMIQWSHNELFLKRERVTGVKRDSPYMSPARTAIETCVPVWISLGECEVLRDAIELLVENMSKPAAARIGVYEVPNGLHDIFVTAEILGWVRERQDMLGDAMRFLESC